MRTNKRDATAELRASFIRRAADSDAPLLATSLRLYEASSGLSRQALARMAGTDEEGLERIACCRPPRPDRFDDDVAAIAAVSGADSRRLASLLRQLQSYARRADLAAEGRADYTAPGEVTPETE